MRQFARSKAIRAISSVICAEVLEGRQLLSIGFDSNVNVTSDHSGVAVIRLIHSSDLSTFQTGAEQVELSVGGGTAIPGVDYTPSTQTINFAATEWTKDVTISVLPTGATGGTRVVELKLSPESSLPGSSNAFLVIQHGPDTIPPTVLGAKVQSKAGYVTGIVVTYSKDMAPGPVSDPNNYVVEDLRTIRPTRRGMSLPKHIALKSANYDPTTHAVTLVPAGRLKTFLFFPVLSPEMAALNEAMTNPAAANPSTLKNKLSPITDVAGNLLDSGGDGKPDGLLFTKASSGSRGARVVKSIHGMVKTPIMSVR